MARVKLSQGTFIDFHCRTKKKFRKFRAPEAARAVETFREHNTSIEKMFLVGGERKVLKWKFFSPLQRDARELVSDVYFSTTLFQETNESL